MALSKTIVNSTPTPVQECPVDLSIANHTNNSSEEAKYPHLRFHHSSIICHSDEFAQTTETNCDTKKTLPSTSSSSCSTSSDIPVKPTKRKIGTTMGLQDNEHSNLSSQKRKRIVDEDSSPQKGSKRSKLSLLESYHHPHPRHASSSSSAVQFNGKFSGQFDPSIPFDPALHGLFDPTGRPKQSVVETESLLAAVQHSQMLYYSYCTQLFQNLNQNMMHFSSTPKKNEVKPTKNQFKYLPKQEFSVDEKVRLSCTFSVSRF